jgi:hypothetical protein
MKHIKAIIFIFVFTFIIISTFTTPATNNKPNITANNSIALTLEDNYRYERVLINGVWWIYVYNSDNILIEKYLEDIV